MATVYLAKDLRHNRKVALKVLKPELAAVVGAERLFLFYVMPHIEGESLRERIDREKQLPVDEAVALVSKVAGAPHYAATGGQASIIERTEQTID